MGGSVAKLVASLTLDDKFTSRLKTAEGALNGFEGRLGRIGGIAQRGVKTAIGNIAKLGAVAAVGIGAAVKSGLDSLVELEKVNAGTQSALTESGLAASISAGQIRDWAVALEDSVDAAVDDKAIQDAANTLIRFGDLTSENVQKAMSVVTDLGAAMKTDTSSAAKQLAKALADPERGMTALRRAGVVLTKEQENQVKAFVKAGDKAKAQALLLDLLEQKTRGAAKATAGPYQSALNKLQDVAEDAKMALAEGFLPVLTRVADLLRTKLSDPKVMDNIREFGRTLARGLDSLISIAERLPWGTIGQSLQIAGAGAKAVLGAFASLPPWIQTAVLTGWGLNKLTGGALGSIVGELGKGLIKGVLGINAGVVNINAAKVIGGGGLPGGAKGGLPAGAAPAAGLGLGAAGLGTLAAGIGGVLAMYLLPYLTKGPQGSSGPTLATNTSPAFATTAVLNSLAQSMTATQQATIGVRDKVSDVSADIRNGFAVQATAIKNGFTTVTSGGSQTTAAIRNGFNVNQQKTAAVASAVKAGDERTTSRIASMSSAVTSKLTSVTGAVNRTTSTLAAKNFSPKITVPVSVSTSVSVRAVTNQQVTVARYTGGTSTGFTMR